MWSEWASRRKLWIPYEAIQGLSIICKHRCFLIKNPKQTQPKKIWCFFPSIYIEITIEPMENEKPESILSLFGLKNFFMSIY